VRADDRVSLGTDPSSLEKRSVAPYPAISRSTPSTAAFASVSATGRAEVAMRSEHSKATLALGRSVIVLTSTVSPPYFCGGGDCQTHRRVRYSFGALQGGRATMRRNLQAFLLSLSGLLAVGGPLSARNISPGYCQDNQGAMRWWDGGQWTPSVRIV
jgi:Protein of unknown function (DUF2510)